MSRARIFAAIGAVPLAAVVWLGAGGSGAAQAGDGDLQEAVDRAVERLGSSDRAERVAGERELLELGPRVLPMLPTTQEVTDAATAEALDRLRGRLEERRLQEWIGPTQILLRGEGKARDVVGGFTLTPEQGERVVSFSGERRTFWVAADDVATQVGAWPDEADDSARLGFRDRTTEDEAKQVGYAGVFRIAAGPVAARPIAGDANGRLLRVPVEIRAEPTIRVLFLSYAATDFSVEAEGGRTSAPFAPGSKLELPIGKAGGTGELRIDFAASGERPAGPVTLRGRAVATIAARQEVFRRRLEATGPAGWATATREMRGDVTVEFREAELRPDGTAEVEIVVAYEKGGPAFESHRSWVYHNLARLSFESEPDGRPASNWVDPEPNLSVVTERDGAAVVRYRFAGIPADARDLSFSYTLPTNIVEVPVEFAIGELPVRSEPRTSEDGAAEDSRDAGI